MTTGSSATSIESRRQSVAVERVTGEWFCQSAAHFTKGEKQKWRGRTVCSHCKQRLRQITKKQRKP